jgi:3-hydroxypropanoate dehydrogenase
MLAAHALGLDTGPMSGFNNAAVDEAFFVGTKVQSNFICTLGYGDKASTFERSPRPAFDRFNSIL